MLKVHKKVLEKIIDHAKKDLPNEACGYLAGNDGNIVKSYPLTNIDKSHEHFSFDPKEQFETVKAARSEGLKLLAVYHSHPQTPARPSKEDIKLAYDPKISYVIVSVAMEKSDVRSFLIVDGKVTKQQIVEVGE